MKSLYESILGNNSAGIEATVQGDCIQFFKDELDNCAVPGSISLHKYKYGWSLFYRYPSFQALKAWQDWMDDVKKHFQPLFNILTHSYTIKKKIEIRDGKLIYTFTDKHTHREAMSINIMNIRNDESREYSNHIRVVTSHDFVVNNDDMEGII